MHKRAWICREVLVRRELGRIDEYRYNRQVILRERMFDYIIVTSGKGVAIGEDDVDDGTHFEFVGVFMISSTARSDEKHW